jgi:hypothetical protein
MNIFSLFQGTILVFTGVYAIARVVCCIPKKSWEIVLVSIIKETFWAISSHTARV